MITLSSQAIRFQVIASGTAKVIYTNKSGITPTAHIPSTINHIHHPTISSPLDNIPPSTKDAGAILDPALGFLVEKAVAAPLVEVTLAGVFPAVVLAAAAGMAPTAGPPQ